MPANAPKVPPRGEQSGADARALLVCTPAGLWWMAAGVVAARSA